MADANSNISVELSEQFIKEFLPFAPGEFLKVYIMTLDIAAYKKPLVSEIAAALNQREMDVISGLEYWHEKGLLTIRNEKEMWVEVAEKTFKQRHASKLYTDKTYNDMLQQLFGTHILKTSEFQLIYDWTEVLNLPKEVCMMVIEYAIHRKGRNVNISYMNAIAKSWAEKGIDSVDSASSEIDRYERISSGANKVLSFIGGVGRLPSKPEMALYQKWTESWGFTLDAIITAISDLSATANPSFKYIDSMLEKLHASGARTSRTISETQAKTSKARDKAKELLSMLNLGLTQTNLDKIKSFEALGFKQEALKLAFAEAANKPNTGLKYVETILKSWKADGLTAKTKIVSHLASQKALKTKAHSFYKKAGLTQTLSAAHLRAYVLWTDENGFEPDMMDAVAEYSSTAKNPYQYMTKVFEAMAQRDITTRDGFNKEKTAFGNKRTNSDYMKRDYSPEDFQADLDHIDISGDEE